MKKEEEFKIFKSKEINFWMNFDCPHCGAECVGTLSNTTITPTKIILSCTNCMKDIRILTTEECQ
ncbi:MAG: hypothetical protein WA061_01770 [Microgenomates group bacterium]